MVVTMLFDNGFRWQFMPNISTAVP